MGRGSSKAGGTGGGGNVISQKATNTKIIDNMNEAQLDREIEKAEAIIDRAQKTMNKNNISNTAEAKAMQEAFPLGVGGDGWSQERIKARNRGLERDARKAKEFSDAYSQKKSAETRLKALKNAKEKVKGTGKTLEEIKRENTKKAVAETPKTLSWKTTQKGGWDKGAYKPKIIKADNVEIHGTDGFYTIFVDGVKKGNTNKLSTAKAYAEKVKKKKE